MLSSPLCLSRMAFTGFISRTTSLSLSRATLSDQIEGGRTKLIAGVTTNIGQRTTQMNDVRATSRKIWGKRRGTSLHDVRPISWQWIDVRAKSQSSAGTPMQCNSRVEPCFATSEWEVAVQESCSLLLLIDGDRRKTKIIVERIAWLCKITMRLSWSNLDIWRTWA